MSEDRPPVEHWRGHLDVPRPVEKPPIDRRTYVYPGIAFLLGLLTLGYLALESKVDGSPFAFLTDIAVIAIVCFVLAACLLAPFPLRFMGWNTSRFVTGDALPLVTVGLVFAAFGLPSLVTLVVLVVTGAADG